MKEYLSTIPYQKLKVWDIKRLIDHSYANSKFPMIKLGELLSETYIEWVEIEDDKDYPILGVHAYGTGVYINRIVKGKELTMKKYQKSKANCLFWCKVRTVRGQFGVVYQEFENTYASSNMKYMKINENLIIPKYLEMIFGCRALTDYMDSFAIGADGRHFNKNVLLDFSIPVPPLSVQAEIINNYQNQVLRAQFIQSEKDYSIIEKILENKLQMQFNRGSQYAKVLAFINYSQCFTWDVRDRGNSVFTSLKYHQLPLSAIAQINPSLSQRVIDEIDVSFIPMECVSDLDGCIKQTRICKSSAKGFTKFENGDIIWAKITPCMQNGKSAVVYNLKNGIGYGSTEFYVIRVNKEFVIPEYIYYLLRTYRVREVAVSYFSGSAGQQRVRKSFLEDLSIPLPSIEEQKEIVEILDAKKAEIISARLQAENLLTKAKQDFENAIFG